MAESEYDLIIVGGGINGAGIARDAAGRGLKVLLAERDDLASHTSNWSSKLIHGGLRYLEHYEFRLVREALIERENLLFAAPHIIWPLTFVLPHSPEQRPAWLIRLGLFLYDHLGGRERLAGSTGVDMTVPGPYSNPLKDWIRKGFTYSDGWVMDSRLVVLNAVAARELGAKIETRTEVIGADRQADRWQVELRAFDGKIRKASAKALVNAAGPWVADFLKSGLKIQTDKSVRLVKGSHIVVPKLHDGEHPYILQNHDNRIVFVIPYEGNYSLIGTTDVDYEGDPTKVAISETETRYLCDVVNRYFKREIQPGDVVWSYSGVRPLYDDASGNASAVTRDYVFDVEGGDGTPPLLSIFGGKITTYRKLAEHAMDRLQPLMGFAQGAWTKRVPLPGGDIDNADFDAFFAKFASDHPWLEKKLAWRLARQYGTRVYALIGDAQGTNALGQEVAPDLLARELEYLIEHEWVTRSDDILWRRSKLGLHYNEAQRQSVEDWFALRAGKDLANKSR